MRYQKPRLKLTGVKFGRLTAVKDIGCKNSSRLWECLCDCGNGIVLPVRALTNGNTASCGCLRKETAANTGRIRNTRHGLDGTPICIAWSGIRARCLNPKEDGYVNYGGRGIKVCAFIKASPLNLRNVIGDRPGNDFSIDRIDNDKHYSCGSCAECKDNDWSLNIKWSTRIEQSRNTRNCVYIKANGQTKCATEWSEISGICTGTILWRYRKGWTTDRLFSKGLSRKRH